MDINLGKLNLTLNQRKYLDTAHITGVRGYFYMNGELTVNHEKSDLSEAEKSEIIEAVSAIPDEPNEKEKRDEVLSKKQSISHDELVELLRLKGII